MIHLIWLRPLSAAEQESRISTLVVFESDITTAALRDLISRDAWVDGKRVFAAKLHDGSGQFGILERRSMSFRGGLVEKIEVARPGLYREASAEDRAALRARAAR